MNFCAVICEYNPFHNGHLYQLGKIREESGCDKILCVMSGNFTQRGEAALFSKYERAKHAVENGADAVYLGWGSLNAPPGRSKLF